MKQSIFFEMKIFPLDESFLYLEISLRRLNKKIPLFFLSKKRLLIDKFVC